MEKGDGTLPHELHQAIIPPPLDVQTEQTFPPSGTANQEKSSGKSSEDNSRRPEPSDKGPQLVVPSSDGPNGSKEEVIGDESTAASTIVVPGSATETKETAVQESDKKQSSVAGDNQPLLPTSDLCNEPDTSASSSQQLEWLTMITWNVNAKCSKHDEEQHTSAQKKKRSKHSEEREEERKGKSLAIRNVLSKFSPHIIILQETSDTQGWDNTRFEVMSLSEGAGIVLLWNKQYLKCIGQCLQSGSKEDLCLSATFSLVANPSIEFKFYGVYGDSTHGFKFNGLDLHTCSDEPWILMGDINLTSDLTQGRSFLPYKRQAKKKYRKDFIDFLKLPHVVEPMFETDKFTHRDYQEVERLSKIDSVICSTKFIELFKRYEIDTCATNVSDHKPVISLWFLK